MKILIIGAKGMLGSDLCAVFQDKNPLCWDKEDIDITDAEAVLARFQEVRPQVVINAAAYTDVDGAETNKEAAYAVNEQGVRSIAEAAKHIGATVVHYSTDYVFSGDKEDGYGEDSAPGPAVNVYGDSKLAGERALKEVNPKFYVLRTAWLFGHNGSNFVETMLKLAQTHPTLSVVNDQHGSPTYTLDVASATRTILEEEYPFGIYHVVNDGVTSWFGFAQKIFESYPRGIVVKPTTSDEFPRPAKRPPYSILLNTKGPRLRSWQEALADYLNTRA